MNLNRARYELTAVKPEQYPQGNLPEIVLAGRSNVGKSSIINMLLGRKNLAKVSSHPGKTRGLNFYNVDDTFYFVDLPGYGYAKVSKQEKLSWGDMIETYLNIRGQIKMVIMLVDIRHSPTGDDVLMYRWISGRGIKHIVVATKADKISKSRAVSRLQDIREVLGIVDDCPLIACSSVTKQGKEEIWNEIRAVI